MKAKDDFRQRSPRLFKADLKFMDLWNVTDEFLQTTSFNEKEKKQFSVQIHNFSPQLRDVILYYLSANKKTISTYHGIATDLKKIAKGAKISAGRSGQDTKHFYNYWKLLIGILKEDARLLDDPILEKEIDNFEIEFSSMKNQ